MRRIVINFLVIIMNYGTYVFAQVMDHVRQYQFNQCVAAYHGHRYVKSLSCRDQFLAMAFGQLSYRESLRDVVTCLSSHRPKLYHLGFRSSVVALPTLAKANEKRDWRIYRDLAAVLIGEARGLYADEPTLASDIDGVCYAIDSTSIDLCLSLFPWAPHVSTKAAIKLHTVMDLRGSIPTFFDMTAGRVNDVNFLDRVPFEPGAFYVIDRGYLDSAGCTRSMRWVRSSSRAQKAIRAYSVGTRIGSTRRPAYFPIRPFFLPVRRRRKNIPTRFAASNTATKRRSERTYFSPIQVGQPASQD